MKLINKEENAIKITARAPFDSSVRQYVSGFEPDTLQPMEYSDWETETLSWKRSCYIHTELSTLNFTLKGSDAEELLNYLFVNSFYLDSFKIGRAKHIVACDEKGFIAAHAVCVRIAEDEFQILAGTPDVITAELEKNDWNAKITDFGNLFIFQMGGPKSLEIIENVIKKDIHDLTFMGTCPATILGHECRILRMGMAGTLSYEIHGPSACLLDIYNEVMRVGEPLGLVKMGNRAYCCQHTENGYVQDSSHFWDSLFMNEGVGEDVSAEGMNTFDGSLADQPKEAYLLNIIEAGWEQSICWKKDFVGKEAVQRLKEDPSTRKNVTLVWNSEDILKVQATLFDDEDEIAEQFGFPRDYQDRDEIANLQCKVVDANGKLIGKTAGRVYTRYYKKMISLAFLDPEYSEIGTEVVVIWGAPGTRQIPIRANVERFPYLDLVANKDYDVESIPHFVG